MNARFTTAPHDAAAGTRPVRVLHVLGDAGTGAGGHGMTGVERVVETLLTGLGPGFVQCAVYPPHGAARERLTAVAASVLQANPHRRYDAAYVHAVTGFARHEHIDVLVSHGLRYDLHAAIAARRIPAAHWVSRAVALADDSYGKAARALYMLADAWTLRACDGIIAVSQASKARMMATQHLPARRITVIPNGVRAPVVTAAERAAAAQALGVQPGEFLVGGMGQLIRRKAFDVLVEAVGRLPEPRPRVVLLGDGPERERLAALARERGVRLVLAGFQPQPHAWMTHFTVNVLPSRAEGMPLAVLEAMALGIACIATPVAGTPEVIIGGTSGLLVPVGDVGALAAAIAALRDDPVRRQALATAGRVRAEQEFSVEAMFERFRALLRAAASRRRSA